MLSLRPVTLVAALLACIAAAPGPVAAAKPAAPDALDRALDRIAGARGGPPAVSVLIQRGRRRELRSHGSIAWGLRARLTGNERMRIASMSKAYSGAVALALVRRGKLRLSDTVGRWLPGLLPHASEVTLAQLLRHTGGVPDYIRQSAFVDVLVDDPRQYLSPRELLGYVRDLPLEFAPGSRYEYSDSDNMLVGLMAQAATGASYERLLARHVRRPLRLRATTLPRTVRMPSPYLRGYDAEPGTPPEDLTHFINPALAWASGGIVSTQREVARFFRAYVGGKLAGAALRGRRQFVPGASSPPGPGRNASGLGLFRYTTRCGAVYGHTGSFPGYRQLAATSADGRRSVVFTVNAQLVPGQGSQPVSRAIRRAQALAVCRALRGRAGGHGGRG